MLGVIYKATCLVSGKSYIGQTNNFKNRKAQHLRSLDDYPFHCAIRKYGADNFIWEILEECDLSKLNERETYWINQYDTYNNGYNCTLGGDNADALNNWRKNNPEQARQQALAALEKANEYNKQHREEHLEHLAKVRQKGVDKTKRKVRCIELDLVFDSLSDAERWSVSEDNPKGIRTSHQNISKVCRGKHKTCGGYHWEYI